MIIIDKAISGAIAGTSLTLQNQVNSQDAVVLILVAASNTQGSAISVTASYNGVNLPSNVTATVTSASSSDDANSSIFLMLNPPVGSFPITVTQSGGSPSDQELVVTILTILGVDKRTSTPITSTATSGAGASTITLTIQSPITNGIYFSVLAEGDFFSTSALTKPTNEISLYNSKFNSNNESAAVSYIKLSTSLYNSTWTLGNSANTQAVSFAAIILEPADSSSIWYPNIRFRNERDVIQATGTDAIPPANYNLRSYPSQFYKNSFLHTIGRILGTSATIPTVTTTNLRTLLGVGT